MIPAVRIRNPFPPHEAYLSLDPVDLAYGFLLCRKQTGSFKISRADPNLVNYSQYVAVGAMVSIERSDGYWPWVGFITDIDDSPNSAYVSVVLSDHTFLLEQARTKWGGSIKGASGRVIRETLYEMNARAEPPLMLGLSTLTDAGPSVDWEYKADKGLSFLQRMRTATGWEWRLEPSVVDNRVTVDALWRERLGDDRRVEVRWEEGKHFTSAAYHAKAKGFVRSTLMTGGSGDFNGLVAIAATDKAQPSDVESFTHGKTRDYDGGPSPVLMGTRTYHEPQISDVESLRKGVRQLFDAPEYIAESLSLSVLESAIDLSRLAIGDIITVQTQNTLRAMRRYVRITGMQFDVDTEVHSIETVVLSSQAA